MAPSPELGQPKAPDKTDPKAEDSKTDSGDKADTAATRTSTSEAEENENFSNWGDGELKALLDEAITYKTPRDRENKSTIFRQLLHHAELEDQEHAYRLPYKKHNQHSSTRHTQGGSLQNLVESANLDEIFGTTKRQNHRHQKHSSVSSRQKEGGSLPINVNVSLSGCNLCPYEQPFMNEVQKKKNKLSKQDQKEESQIYDGKMAHTVIDIGDQDAIDSHHLAHDSLAQTIIDPMCVEEGSELSTCQKIPRIHLTQAQIEISGDMTAKSSIGIRTQQNVDKFVPFSLIDNSSNKNIVEKATPLQLGSQYNAVKSIIDNKSDTQKNMQSIIMSSSGGKFLTSSISSNMKLLDENGNSVPQFNSSLPTSSQSNKPKSKKQSKSDRNTIIVDYSKKEGFRGNDEINELVRYIEETESEKNKSKHYNNNNNNSSSNNNSNNYSNAGAVLNNNKKQKSSNNNSNNKKEGKLKKCNSLEELSSCSKLKEMNEQFIATTNNEHDVAILRNKNITSNIKKSPDPTTTTTTTAAATTTTNNANSKKLSQQKRSERRSWGTEELSYLGDNNNKLDINNDSNVVSLLNDQRKIKNISNKKEDQLVPVVSVESILQSNNTNETSEFLLVTKKKKPKKKLDDLRNNNQNCNNKINVGNNSVIRGNNNSRSKYSNNSNHQINNNHTSHFANDRDLYLTSFNSSDNNRRKSTSSVPPSERSDSSDIDSVHSLPVGSSSTNKHSISQNTPTDKSTSPNSLQNGYPPSQISYAEIAKKANKESQHFTNYIEKFPNIINSPEIEHNIQSKDINKLSYANVSPSDTKVISTATIVVPLNETKILQKSKSVDNESYNVSIDQYPALEKTIKNKNSNMHDSKSKLEATTSVDNLKKNTNILSNSNLNNNSNKKIEPKIEVSELEKTIIDKIYSRPNPNILKQVVVNNNNNINITKLNEFTQGATSIIAPLTASTNIDDDIQSTKTTTSIQKRHTKKDKTNTNDYSSSTKNLTGSSHTVRPAVIILNDNNDKTNNDITFGFEINEQLLFGDDFVNDEGKSIESNDKTNDNISDYFSVSDTSTIDLSLNSNSHTAQMQHGSSNINSTVNLENNSLLVNVNDIEMNSINNNTKELSFNKEDQQLEILTSKDKQENTNIKTVLQVKFVLPNDGDRNITGYNHEKIVHFIGTTWEDIISGTTGSAQYYNGQ